MAQCLNKKKKIVVFGGCGTVGQRVRDAINKQDDMEVYAVVTNTAKENVLVPYSQNIPIYTVDPQEVEKFKQLGINDIGTIDELVKKKQEFDLIVDCSPDKIGIDNINNVYRPNGIRAIIQGGEKADSADVSFNAHTNYDDAIGKDYVRVVSCNTTGAARVLNILSKKFGIIHAHGELDRRGNDPHQKGKLPNGAEGATSLNSHHAPDLETVIYDIKGKVVSDAKKSDKQEFHSHTWGVHLLKEVTRQEVIDALDCSRIILLSGKGMFGDTKKVRFYANEISQRGDIHEIIIWPKEYIRIFDKYGRETEKGHNVKFKLLVDQQCIVVPENIDAIRAMLNMATAEESVKKTDASLGIGKKCF